jgi:hypothetical protein
MSKLEPSWRSTRRGSGVLSSAPGSVPPACAAALMSTSRSRHSSLTRSTNCCVAGSRPVPTRPESKMGCATSTLAGSLWQRLML